MRWISEMSILAKKPLAPTTVQQKISHINFLTELKPPLLPGGPILAPRYFKGLNKITPMIADKKLYLPPSFIVRLATMQDPGLIHLSIQMQMYLGLRGGHFSILEPQMFMDRNVLLPPFKFQKRPVLLPLHHVPPALLEKFLLMCNQEHYAPLLPWLPSTYKKKFREVTLELGLPNASHSARHTFGTIQAILGTDMNIIQRYLIHKRGKTTEVYVHSMTSREVVACSPLVAIAPNYLME